MKIYLVGGAVRDKLLGLPVKERDWVVVGATVKDMLDRGYRQVGKEFPVFLHPKTGEEYALARMERKVRPGYQGFNFDTSPHVTLEDDLIRRDLTINAMAETAQGELIDPYHGKADLEKKILRHVSPAFAEDPVRILRVGRLLARYAHLGFHVAAETMELMRNMVASGEVNALVAERVWKELERALGEKNPEKFFDVLAECGALPVLFPHLLKEGAGMKGLAMTHSIDIHLDSMMMPVAKPEENIDEKVQTNTLLRTAIAEIRFAILLHALPEDGNEKLETKKIISHLCNRYRVPNSFRELALLTAQHHEKALHAQTLSADELLQLLSSLDIFRREDRFKKFLFACFYIAKARGETFDPMWLLACAQIAKSIDVQALIAQGFEGNTLALELKRKRSEKIEQWLKTHQQLSS
ncbi:multifunctional CCA addition/repair protein [Aquicella lusitana]|uniref:CCA-adding enzyme n=1 Tax=Aquicella lusitana TaxID=254246 RepID=A0A370G5W2_9COXI|nr:multifunctional CCA addition/repair protein [Aquicella lusitana]RDI39208.1 tRNA nucleotidyltransferase (CCA-adding enzyme) [Aquicella lusitana]VVC74067.1 Multifunctional CCA protein [Aquicella lusitana]